MRTYTAYRITIPSKLIQKLGWDAQTVLLFNVHEEKDGRRVLVVKPVPTPPA